MKILIDSGDYQILSPVELNADAIYKHLEFVARTCYRSEDKATPESAPVFLKKILHRGHLSIFEHAGLTVKFTGVSRGFSHEMVRHRICSFAQESTRYVDTKDLHMILPPGTDPSATIIIEGVPRTLESEVMRLEELYRALREQLRWKPEDARQFLPNGVETAICVTCNFREWREIFQQRCSRFAHWEIRAVMLRLLKDFYEYLPVLFEDIYQEFYENA